MKKAAIAVLIYLSSALPGYAQQRWDNPMQLINCSIQISADYFTATTFIEMEFFNPNDREIEGLEQFELSPGQAITNFQLELNGKYRDGSIEERWKATNAYNSIVGKRIDPALLTMDYANHYTLRVFPIRSKESRKVTMTIQQLLPTQGTHLKYLLPLRITDVLRHFNLSIKSVSFDQPATGTGLIEDIHFTGGQGNYSLQFSADSIALSRPIVFDIPLPDKPFICTGPGESQTQFAARLRPTAPRQYPIHPKTLTVFWDASGSAVSRDTRKEMSFLKQYISWHNISQVSIIPFNYKPLDTAIFYTENGFNSRWQQYLQELRYDGATQLGAIDMTSIQSDMVLLFSDGNNTYGRRYPRTGNAIVSCIFSSATANLSALQQICGTTGGTVIDLKKYSLASAITVASRGQSWLMDITCADGRVITEQRLPLVWENVLFLNGEMRKGTDTLLLHYGNNRNINFVEKIPVNAYRSCSQAALPKINMLNNFEEIIRYHNWSGMIDFGLREKVVTPNTAYIVLERVEDYIRYNIAPPKDLEDECMKMKYVKRDTREERARWAAANEAPVWQPVVNAYNFRISNWDQKEALMKIPPSGLNGNIPRGAMPADTKTISQGNTAGDTRIFGNAGENALQEVVVVGYASSRKSNLTGSVSYLRQQDISPSATSIAQVLEGRVAGLSISRSSSPSFVAPGEIRIRGASSTMAGREPLYILDGIPVSGNINDFVNVNDVESITVLRNPGASALYGSQAANGAILINTKRGKASYNNFNDRPYRLKDMEDVDYLQELKAAEMRDKVATFQKLAEEYGGEPGFYFDAAQHFFDIGLQTLAIDILMNGAEASNGSYQVQMAIAYILESWRHYGDAIALYEQLIEENPGAIELRSSLAWNYYRMGKYQESVDALYSGITMPENSQNRNDGYRKALLLDEMNAIIAIHRSELDLSRVPSFLIRPLPVDMRVVIYSNAGTINGLQIKEPDGSTCEYMAAKSKIGGRIIKANPLDTWAMPPSPLEYQIRNAVPGKYKMIVTFYDYYSYPVKIPSMARIMIFRNYGKANQSIEIENVMLDNQSGQFEMAEIQWK